MGWVVFNEIIKIVEHKKIFKKKIRRLLKLKFSERFYIIERSPIEMPAMPRATKNTYGLIGETSITLPKNGVPQ